MTFLLSMSVILSPCFIFAYFKKRAEEVIPLVIFIIIFFLYIFGILGNLRYGKYFIIACSVISLMTGLFLIIKKKDYIETAKHIFTPAFFVFLIAAIFIWIQYSGRSFSEWDEFSYWGLYAKSAALTDNLTPPWSIHPPGIILFEYFISSFSHSFKEADLYRAYILLMFSLFLPFMKNIRYNIFMFPKLLLVCMSFLSLNLFYEDGFSTLYADPMLIVFFAYCLTEALHTKELCVAVNNKSHTPPHLSFIRLLFGVFILTLIKGTAIYLSLIACLVCIAKMWQNKRGFSWEKVAKALFVLALPFLSYFSWRLAVNHFFHSSGSFEINLIKAIPSVAATSFNPTGYRYEVASKFIHYLFYAGITSGGFSYMMLLAILLPLFYVFSSIGKMGQHHISETKEKFAYLKIYYCQHIIVLGAIGYALFYLFCYLVIFSQREALALASYNRYLVTYVGGLFVSLTMMTISALSKDRIPAPYHKNAFIKFLLNPGGKSMIINYCLWIILLLFVFRPSFLNFSEKENSYKTQAQIIQKNNYALLDKLYKLNLSTKDKVWLIAQGSWGFEDNYYSYYLYPLKIKGTYRSLLDPKYKEKMAAYTNVFTFMDANEWSKLLLDGDYDFVAIDGLSDDEYFYYENGDDQSIYFQKSYASLFESPERIGDNTVWRVERYDDGVKLVFVE